MYLPEMVYRDKLRKTTQVRFGGLMHRKSASDGDLYDMENLTSDEYPVLSTRAPRKTLYTVSNGTGLFADGEHLYYTAGGTFYCDGNAVGSVSNSQKEMAKIGSLVIIMPDKKCYDTESGELSSLEASVSGEAVFEDGTLYGESAEANTLHMDGVSFASYFREGDGVNIEGNFLVIREIDGDRLRFGEHSFVTGTRQVTVSRSIPPLSHICEHENRLWGCEGRTIWASKLGDPRNFYVYEGISTDSYSLELSCPGILTACASYAGYPMFFAEDCIFKIYGTRPTNFSVSRYDTLGVKEGAAASLAVAGEMLFYISRKGVCVWTDGSAAVISEALGVPVSTGAGGSDGLKYYVCQNGVLYAYDTVRRLWMREDATSVSHFAMYCGQAAALTENAIVTLGGGTGEVSGYVIFGDMTMESPDRKRIVKFQLRIAARRFQVLVSYDGGRFEPVYEAEGEDRTYLLPIVPRRCDRLRLCVKGVDFKIDSLSVTYADAGE